MPCGALATQIFKNAGVTVKPDSQEQNVGGVVTKVTLGEADAGIVYVTDVKANGSAPNATAAAAFISYVLGPDGQQVLKSFGFLPPTS